MSTLESIVNKRLDGKVAIITGATGGIGSAAARLFAAHGAEVILADVTGEEKGVKLSTSIGPHAHYRHCDVTKEEDIASTVDFAVEKFGKLDIMYNNAGILSGVEQFETIDLDAYDRATAVLVRGVVAGIKHASRVMVPNKQGVILNTASTASVTSGDIMPLAYNIGKSNIPGLTRVAAFHLGKHGIRVNAISPHAVLTPMSLSWINDMGFNYTEEQVINTHVKASTLLGKRCRDVDIANGALFLCSEESDYVSGQNLVVDGAWTCSHQYGMT